MDRVEFDRIIKDRVWERGVQVYDLVGKDVFLKRLFSGAKSDYLEERLWEELGKLKIKSEELKVGASIPLPSMVSSASTNEGEMTAGMPQNVYRELLKARAAWAELKRARVGIFDDDKEIRKVAALRILALQDEARKAYYRVEFWKKHGGLPDSIAKEQGFDLKNMTADEVAHQLYLVKNYRWRGLKRLETLSGQMKIKQEQRIATWTTQITQLQAKLASI